MEIVTLVLTFDEEQQRENDFSTLLNCGQRLGSVLLSIDHNLWHILPRIDVDRGSYDLILEIVFFQDAKKVA